MGTSEPRLPESTSVVVIGGGIVGVCTAFYLARQGIDVVLCEKGDIACEQSSRNWGWIITVGRDRREIPLRNRPRRPRRTGNTLVSLPYGGGNGGAFGK